MCSSDLNLTMIIASDGLWDLYEPDEVFEAIVDPPADDGAPQRTDRAAAFFEQSLDKGDEIFEEHTDNITHVVVYLNPAAAGGAGGGGKPPPSPKPGSGREYAMSAAACFSV